MSITASSTVLGDDAITVGSFDFQGSILLAEVYSQALEASGYRVHRRFALGPREFVGQAVTRGLVAMVPEYAGTALQFVSLGAAQPSDYEAATHDELVRSLGDGAVTALAAPPAQNVNTFVVTCDRGATRPRWAEPSRAGGRRPDVRGAAGMCRAAPVPDRLEEGYGVMFADLLSLDVGGPVTRQALGNGEIDVALLFTTDPAIDSEGLVELVDDRGLQPAENVTPLIRTEVIDRWGPGIVDVIDGVSRLLTEDAVRALNAAVVVDPGSDTAAIAAAWLHAKAAS